MTEQLASTNIELILVRMEFKMDRMNDRFERYEKDHASIRERVHDLNNAVQPLVILDLPARIRTSDQHNAKVDARIQALEDIEQQRKGAAQLMKILWTIGGAIGGGGAVALFKVFS